MDLQRNRAGLMGMNWLRGWRENKVIRSRQRPGTEKSLADFERFIGYKFHNPELLERALRHRSILTEINESRLVANERLEFLGDAVLDLIVSEFLYKQNPDSQEGYLARMKSLAVSGRQLASKARKMGLGAYLQLSDGEARSGGRKRRSILEDALEAIIGAIYLDGGLTSAKTFVHTYVTEDLDGRLIREREQNFKSLLLEYSQAHATGSPEYRVTGEEGPDHAKTFYVDVLVGNVAVGSGAGRSKKQAEQDAAKQAAAFFDLT